MSTKKSFSKLSSAQTNQQQLSTGLSSRPLFLTTTPTKVNQSHLAVIHGLGSNPVQGEDGEFRITTPSSTRNKSFNSGTSFATESKQQQQQQQSKQQSAPVEDDTFDLDAAETATMVQTPNKVLTPGRRTLTAGATTATALNTTPSRQPSTSTLPTSIQKSRQSTLPISSVNKRSTVYAVSNDNMATTGNSRNSVIPGFNLDTSNLPSTGGTPNGTPSKRPTIPSQQQQSAGSTPSSLIRRQTNITPSSSVHTTPSSSKVHDKGEVLENIQTFIRICPAKPTAEGTLLMDIAPGANNTTSLTLHHVHSQGTPVGLNKKQPHVFNFDAVIGSDARQDEVYQTILGNDLEDTITNMTYRSIIVISYGQTGSGKTFTSLGKLSKESKFSSDTSSHGIVPRLLSQIFKSISSTPDPSLWSVKMSFIEALDGTLKVKDLLYADKDSDAAVLEINAKLSAIQRPIASQKEAMTNVEVGVKRRQTATTDQNDQSSRTHALVSFHLYYKGELFNDINLFDLAGSEKNEGKDKATAAVGSKINSSLTTLQGFLRARISGEFKSGRESTLTKLFQRCYDTKPNAMAPATKLKFVGCVASDKDAWTNTRTTLVYTEDAKKVKQVEAKEDSSERSAQLRSKSNRYQIQRVAMIKIAKELGLHQPDGDEPHNMICRVYDIFNVEGIMADIEQFEVAERDYIESLKSVTAGNATQLTELISQLDQLKLDMAALQGDYAQLQAEQLELSSQKDMLGVELANVTSEKDSLTTNLAALELTMAANRTTIIELKQTIASNLTNLEHKMAEHDSVMTALRDQLATAEAKHFELSADYDRYEKEMNLTCDAHEIEAKNQNLLLTRCYRAFRKSLATQRAKMNQQRDEMNQKMISVQTKSDKMAKVQVRVAELNSGRTMKRMHTIFSLLSKTMFSSLHHQRQVAVGLKKVIADLQDRSGGAVRSEEQANNDNNNNAQALVELKTQLRENEVNQTALTTELAQLQSKHGAMLYEHDSLKANYDLLNDNFTALEHHSDKLSAQRNELAASNVDFEQQNAKLVAQLAQGRILFNANATTLTESTKLFQATWPKLDNILAELKTNFFGLVERAEMAEVEFQSFDELCEENEEVLLELTGKTRLRHNDESLPQSLRDQELVYWKTLNRYEYAIDAITLIAPDLKVLEKNYADLKAKDTTATQQIAMGRSILAKLQSKLTAVRKANIGLKSECVKLDKKCVELDGKVTGLEASEITKHELIQSQQAQLDSNLIDFEVKMLAKEQDMLSKMEKLSFVEKCLITSQQQAINFRTELASNKEKLLATQQQLKDLQSDVKDGASQSEKEKFMVQIDELTAQQTQLMGQKAELESNFGQLETQLTTAQAQITKLTSSIASLNRDMKVLADQANGKAAVEGELNQCQTQLLHLHQAHEHLKTRHIDFITRKEDLEKEVVALRKIQQLYGVQEKNEALYNEQINDLRDKCSEVEQKLTQANADLVTSQSTTGSLRKQIVDCDLKHNEVVGRYKKEIAGLVEANNTLKANKVSLEKDISTIENISQSTTVILKAAITKLETDVTSLTTESAKSKELTASLERDLAVSNVKNERLVNEVEALRAQLAAAQKFERLLSTQHMATAALQAQFEIAQKTVDGLGEELIVKDDQIAELNRQNAELDARVDSLLIELPREYQENHSETLTQLNTKYELRQDSLEEKYNKKLSSAQTELKVTKALIKGQKKQIVALENTKTELLSQNEKNTAAMVQLNDVVGTKSTQIDALSTQLNESRTQLAITIAESDAVLSTTKTEFQDKIALLTKEQADLAAVQKDTADRLAVVSTSLFEVEHQLGAAKVTITSLEEDKVKMDGDFNVMVMTKDEAMKMIEATAAQTVAELTNQHQTAQQQSELNLSSLNTINNDLIQTVKKQKGLIELTESKLMGVEENYNLLEAKMKQNDLDMQQIQAKLLTQTESKISSLQVSIQEDKKQYEAELKTKDEVIQALNGQVLDVQKQIESAQCDNRAKNDQIAVHVVTIKELSIDIESQMEFIKDSKQQIIGLNSQLIEQKSAIEQTKVQNDLALVQFESKFNGMKNSYQERITTLEDRVKQLTQTEVKEQQRVVRDRDSMQAEMGLIQNQVVALEGQLTTVTAQLDTTQSTLNQTIAILSNTQSTLDTTVAHANTVQIALDQVNAELLATHSSLEEVSAKLTAAQVTNTTMTEIISTLETTILDKDGKIAVLQMDVNGKDENLADCNAVVAKHVTKLAALETLLLEKGAQETKLKSVLADKETILSQLQSAMIEKEAMLVQLQSLIVEKEAEFGTQSAEMDATIAVLKSNSINFEAQISLLEQQLEQQLQQQEHQQQISQTAKMTEMDELHQTQTKLAALQSELTTAQDQLIQIQAKLSTTEAEHESILNLFKETRRDEDVKLKALHKVEIAQLEDDVQRLQGQNYNFADALNQTNERNSEISLKCQHYEKACEGLKKRLQRYEKY